MNFPPFLFHPINSITAYKGQIIYDTPETEAKAETPVPYLQWQPAPGVTPPQPSADTDLQFPDGAAGSVDVTRRWSGGRRRRDPNAPAGAAAPASSRGAVGDEQVAAYQGIASRPADGGYRRRRRAAGRAAQFGGLNSLNMPGTAGHGSGSYKITVRATRRRHPAAELAGDGRRRHRGQRVGNRRGSASGRHVLCGRPAVAGPERQAARECHGQGCADLTAGFPARRIGRAGRREAAVGQAQGRLDRFRWTAPVATRRPRRCCPRSAWWSTRAISVRCKTSPMRPTTRSRAGKAASPIWCLGWRN